MIKCLRRIIKRELYRVGVSYVNSYAFKIEKTIENYRKENQSLIGRIKLLEEQHEIMHNFLVEINKYLVNFSDKHKS